VISAHRIIRLTLYNDTVYGVRCVHNILSSFFAELTEEGRLYDVFQKAFAILRSTCKFGSTAGGFW
jgi:hypothetical protein